MIFEWMSDPAAWVGLATLIVLEIVLGIDNLVFIAILAEKLPPEQRNKARIVGLMLALVMRLILLASIAWVVTLTQPLFSIFEHPFSGHEATSELVTQIQARDMLRLTSSLTRDQKPLLT